MIRNAQERAVCVLTTHGVGREMNKVNPGFALFPIVSRVLCRWGDVSRGACGVSVLKIEAEVKVSECCAVQIRVASSVQFPPQESGCLLTQANWLRYPVR